MMSTASVVTSQQRRHTVAVPDKPKRRYSTPFLWISQLNRKTKSRAASSAFTGDGRSSSPAPPAASTTFAEDEEIPIPDPLAKGAFSAVTEDEESVDPASPAPLEAVEDDVAEDGLAEDDLAPLAHSATWQRRLSKRVSVVNWAPEWHLQGALPVVQESVTGTLSAIRRMSRTEPSHETNFPPNKEFPEEGGLRTVMPIYGIIDAYEPKERTMRLLTQRGFRQTTISNGYDEEERQKKPFEMPASALKNGDWICRPKTGPYAEDSSMAMVLRGEIQGFQVKCRIVGMFPIAAFGDKLPETYEMELMIF